MNVTPIVALSIAVLCVATAARSQPSQALSDAVLALAAADNYTWEQVNETDTNGRRTSEKSWGKTIVDGYTVATVDGFQAVFRGNDSVFELKNGWRHVRDLAPEELHQLRRVPNLVQRGTARNYAYIPIHDMLRALVAAATDVWEHEGVIKGELPYEFERHLMMGTLPALRSMLGMPRRTSSPGPGARVSPSMPTGALSVWVKDGNLTKVSVEFARTFTNPSGPRHGELTTLTRTYTVELSRLGKTNVTVPPEAEVLFVK